MAAKGKRPNKANSHTYYVQGMHCRACELAVERKLRQRAGVISASASAARGEVLVGVRGVRPTAAEMTRLFADEGYTFHDERPTSPSSGGFARPLALGLVLIAAFLGLERLGLAGILSTGGTSSLAAVALLGLLAGLSTCAALVGGIVLSLSRGWGGAGGRLAALRPPLEFNLGRLLSFAAVGAALGAVGARFSPSYTATAVLALLVSAAMAVAALGMLGVRPPAWIPPLLPSRPAQWALGASSSTRPGLPLLTGAMTFILPCGFTFTAQGLAVLSGDPVRGALTMLAFALGTAPTLLLIGYAGVRLAGSARRGQAFARAAGVLVLFFALYTANAQLNVLGVANGTDVARALAGRAMVAARAAEPTGASAAAFRPQVLPGPEPDLAPVDEDGVQVLKMDALSYAYRPDNFRVLAGVPVRWEIRDQGFSGCTNAVVSRGLIPGEVRLVAGGTTTVEFTPVSPGRFKFSCWMGMVSGTIDVVEAG